MPVQDAPSGSVQDAPSGSVQDAPSGSVQDAPSGAATTKSAPGTGSGTDARLPNARPPPPAIIGQWPDGEPGVKVGQVLERDLRAPQ